MPPGYQAISGEWVALTPSPAFEKSTGDGQHAGSQWRRKPRDKEPCRNVPGRDTIQMGGVPSAPVLAKVDGTESGTVCT